MKIQVLSDLHLEFHKDRGQGFIRSLDPDGVDVLVLAGDISTVKSGLINKLRMFCDRFAQVIFVLGNHEYYGSTKQEVLDQMARLNLSNFHWLYDSEITIEGQRFVGNTLWFKDEVDNVFYMGQMNDFNQIPGILKWVGEENAKSIEYLEETIKSSDVVVTHHLPSKRSTPSRFAQSSLNRFFVCEMDRLIEQRQPKLWVHGHTHDSCSYTIGETRIVCNPFGYAHVETNSRFQDNFIVGVGG